MISDGQLRHIGLVRDLSSEGGALDKSGPNATVSNPEWFYRGGVIPRRGRAVLHTRLKQEIRDRFPNAEQGGQALVLAGPPGAGKGSVSDTVLGVGKAQYVNVDADEFKKLLLREAIADGSYESWIVPTEVRDLEGKGERFYPLELASLVHEESSILAEELRRELIDGGVNVIVDTVLSNPDKAVELGRHLAEAGYEVTVVDVEVPFEVSQDRIVQRWREAMADAERGVSGELGGRWVPSTYARPLFDTEHGRATSQDAAELLARSCGAVMKYERYFTSIQEHELAKREERHAVPQREVLQVRREAGGSIIDPALADTMRRFETSLPPRPIRPIERGGIER